MVLGYNPAKQPMYFILFSKIVLYLKTYYPITMLRNIFTFLLLCMVFVPFSGQAKEIHEYCLGNSDFQEAKREYAYADSKTQKAVDRAGWTWKASHWDGDVTQPSRLTSPDEKNTIEFSWLYRYPCNSIKNFFSHCELAHSEFNKNAKITFYRGYEKNFLGLPLQKSFAFYGSNKIALPGTKFKTSRYAGKIYGTNLSVLVGTNNEFFTFDGLQVRKILYPSLKFPDTEGFPWLLSIVPQTKQTFFHNTSHRDIPQYFLFEVINGQTLREITLPNNISGSMVYLSIPNTNQVWGLDRNGIYAIRGNTLEKILSPSEDSYLVGPAGMGLTDEGDIYFAIKKKSDPYSTYSGKPVVLQLRNKNCIQNIDLNKDQKINIYP